MPRDHGSFPNRAKAALLLIDVINDLEFPDAEALLERAVPMAKRLAELKRRARKHRIPAIYINENFGLFTANDAYMRDYALYIPRDCVAANTVDETSYALGQMSKLLKADIRQSDEIDFKKLGATVRE